MSDPVIDPEKEVEAQVQQELEEYCQKNRKKQFGELNEQEKEGVISFYLNNFWCDFPRKDKESVNGEWTTRNNQWDLTGREIIESSSGGDYGKKKWLADVSEKFLITTPRQFRNDLLNAISESGIEIEKLHEFVENAWKGGGGHNHHAYAEYFFPVYRKMRMKGYDYHQLTGTGKPSKE